MTTVSQPGLMETTAVLETAEPAAGGKRSSAWWRSPSMVVPLLILAFLALATALPGLLATHDPLRQDLTNALSGPSWTHWLGTDEAGRDVWSRLVHGTRVSLLAGAYAAGLAAFIGVPLGMFSGYVVGRFDRIAMRAIDVIMALPGLFLAIAMIAVFGGGLVVAMTAVSLVFVPGFARLSRAEALRLRGQGFVESSRLSGRPRRRILAVHLLPNMATVLLVQFALTLALAILAESGLSLLGFGLEPPDPSWGGMLSQGSRFMARQGWLVVWPGVALTVTVLSINLLSDALQRRFSRSSSVIEDSGPVGAVSPARSVARPSVGLVASDHDTGVPAPDGSGAALAIRGLSIAFPADGGRLVPAVDDVDLAVDQGRVLGLVGESGSGKTLTALAGVGHIPTPGVRTAGQIWVNGTDITSLSGPQLQRLRREEVGFVFQSASSALDPMFTVGNQVDEVLRFGGMSDRKRRRSRAIELLDEVEIADAARRLDDYPAQFSGGMAQRVLIALALANNPRVLIADEPTTALDVAVQQGILDLIRALSDDHGLGVLFVTHDFGVAADLCDDIAVMYAGQIVETSASEPLFADPRHPYTRGLMRALPVVGSNSDPRGIPGRVPAPGTWGAGCRFANRCAMAIEACTAEPVRLLDAGVDRSSRCIRLDDLEPWNPSVETTRTEAS